MIDKEFIEEIFEKRRHQRYKASGEFKQDVWVTINQVFITAGLIGQGRLYFPLSEEILGAIPVDEFIAEMQRRGYTVWKNESKTVLMVDMNLPQIRDCVPQSREE